MRIAIVNWTRRRAGGAESYIESAISGLYHAGYELAFLSMGDMPRDRESIALPEGTPVWRADELEEASVFAGLRKWNPDLLYVHSDLDAQFETGLLEVAPAIFFAHGYRGTCVSGQKSHRFPAPVPCERRFGPQCLMHYYPRRCGGLNPLTMLTEYWRQRDQLNLLQSYEVILTASEYVRQEYLRHGFSAEIVRCVHLPAASFSVPYTDVLLPVDGDGPRHAVRQLLFVGRMTPVKGIDVLFDSLPLVSKALGAPVKMLLVGDGPERPRLEARATRLVAQGGAIEIEFRGWVQKSGLEEIYAKTDLLIIPSLWPEPFGLVGIEAGLDGVPAAAFAVGGIPEWLADGINGHLAPADPPTAAGLARTIVKCMEPRAHAALRRGAQVVASQFTIERHVTELTAIFQELTHSHSEILETAQL